MVDRYVLGQGKVHLDEIDAATGLPVGKARFVGNVPVGGLIVTPQAEKIMHEENYTGNNYTDLIIERKKKAMGTLRLEDINKENLILALYGTGTDKAGATITSESHTAYKGYSFFLNRINLTSFTSLTSDPAGTTYVNGTDYTVNLKTGEVIIPSGSAIAAEGTAVLANYVAGASEIVTLFTGTNTEKWLRFSGVNNADNDKPIVMEGFRVRLQPAKQIDLINEQVTNLDMDLEFLYQSLLDGVADYGPLLRMYAA